MNRIIEKSATCPHCGHSIRFTLDGSNGNQSIYEDCPACCCPIHLNIEVDQLQQDIKLSIDGDDEQLY
jgi:hypothetical protein